MANSNFDQANSGIWSRRDFISGIGVAMAGASVLPAAEAFVQSEPGGGFPLFNGKDLSGFYTHLVGYEKNNDPKQVFSVHDGMLHISGEVNGCIVSEQEYGNYRLVAEYKWGTKMWPPRETNAMDCGLLMHCGNEDGVNFGLFPRSIQFQIYQGAVGDLVLLPGNEELSAMIEGEDRAGGFQYVSGAPAQQRQAGGDGPPFNIAAHFGKDPEWQNVKGFHSPNDATLPHDQWNTMEVIADGDTLTCRINGREVNKATNLRITSEGTDASLTRGRIGIQSESGEIFFRRLELFASRPSFLEERL